MPRGPGTYGSKMGRPPSKAKKAKGLTDRQKATLKKHKVHHTAMHMKMMRELMMNGMSFTQAHKKAMSKVGK